MVDLALITGASSGIGAALARRLAEEGIPLILSGRDRKRLEQVALELPVETQIIAADLVVPEGRVLVRDAIRRQKPQLVVNNAGFGLYGAAADLDTEKQMDLIAVNVAALQELTLESVKALKGAGKKGTIMNISSAAAFQVFPYFAVYSASKAFVNQLSQSIDAETAPDGIRVLASCPGMVRTNFRVRSGGKEDHSIRFMTDRFAAEEIWKQIQSGKGLHTFDWRYRLGTFLSRYILPQSLVTAVLRRRIHDLTK